MKIVPYKFRKAVFMHSHVDGVEQKGYWVTLYCFFDGERIHHFAHQSEWLDNQCFAIECGYNVDCFTQEFLVTPNRFPEIFNDIENYVHSPDFS